MWCWLRMAHCGDGETTCSKAAFSAGHDRSIESKSLACKPMSSCCGACVCMVCRGSNACGSLGTGDAGPRSAPTRVTSAATLPHGSGASSGPRRSKSGGPGARASSASATPVAPTYSTGPAPAFRAIAAGSDFVAAVGKADGQVYTWGNRCVVRVCGDGFVCLAVCTASCVVLSVLLCVPLCVPLCMPLCMPLCVPLLCVHVCMCAMFSVHYVFVCAPI